MKNIFQDLKRKDHKRYLGGLDVFKYIGPGLLVTVGFIDPRPPQPQKTGTNNLIAVKQAPGAVEPIPPQFLYGLQGLQL